MENDNSIFGFQTYSWKDLKTVLGMKYENVSILRIKQLLEMKPENVISFVKTSLRGLTTFHYENESRSTTAKCCKFSTLIFSLKAIESLAAFEYKFKYRSSVCVLTRIAFSSLSSRILQLKKYNFKKAELIYCIHNIIQKY